MNFFELAKILVCPKTGKTLEYDSKNHIFVNKEEDLYYEIIKEIPILLKEEAKPLKDLA